MKQTGAKTTDATRFIGSELHPAWKALVQYCLELRYGEIQALKIQDGLPVMAEAVVKKVKFSGS